MQYSHEKGKIKKTSDMQWVILALNISLFDEFLITDI